LLIDRATIQSSERVQVAADLDSQRIADEACSDWLETRKPYEALDLGRRRSVVRSCKRAPLAPVLDVHSTPAWAPAAFQTPWRTLSLSEASR